MGKGRAPCCDKNQVKRGPWSPAEDLRLITFIQNHGHDNWRALPKQAGLLRCGKSCRLRWINYLRPDVKRGNFTQDEEETIIKLHKVWGNKWSKIASRLPGRTDNEIKNVWNTHLKKKLSPETTKVICDISSGDELKESSPTSTTTSSDSSSSNQTLNSHTQPFNNDRNSESSNSNSSSPTDIFWPENHFHIDFGDEVEKKKKKKQQQQMESGSGSESELESESPPATDINMEIEIPLECDIDFWNMLDLDNIDLFFEGNEVEDRGCQGSNFGAEKIVSGEFENDKWFKYLENELGLDRPPESDADETAAENLNEKLLVADVDPCMAYFADGFPRQP